jgi:hypothetical protein
LPPALVKEFFTAVDPGAFGLEGTPDLEKVATMLKAEPALIDVTDAEGETALHHVLTEEMAEALLKAGAEVDAPSRAQQTPLFRISNRGDESVVKILLAHGAAVDGANGIGQTPLRHAAEMGYEGMVTLLLAHKADVNRADDAGVTPLMAAAGEPADHQQVVELLLAAGADRAARNPAGRTALDVVTARKFEAGDSDGLAAQQGIIRLLAGRGAAKPRSVEVAAPGVTAGASAGITTNPSTGQLPAEAGAARPDKAGSLAAQPARPRSPVDPAPAALSAQEQFEKGWAYHMDSNWEAAIPCYREAVRLKPDESGYLVKLGYVLVRHGDFGEAVGAYEHAISLGDNYGWTLVGYGEALAGAGRPKEALAQMDAAVKTNPGNDLIQARRDKLAATVRIP